jgi:hypothetical protein
VILHLSVVRNETYVNFVESQEIFSPKIYILVESVFALSLSENVREQLRVEGVDFANDEIFILAGKNYYKYQITDEFSNVKYLYKNMKIGQILQFLSK